MITFMMALDWYYFTEISDTCTQADFGLTREFIQLEVMIFYLLMISSILFLVLSKFFLKQSGLMYLEKEETDFL